MAIHFSSLPLSAILFTHFDDVSGEQMDICVSSLAQEAKDFEIVEVPIIPEHALMIAKKRGIERHRLLRLMGSVNDTGSSPAFKPVLFIHMPDDTWLLADGSHRYVAGHLLSFKFLKAQLVEEAIWKKHLVEGLPRETEEGLLKSFSGIL